jgi:hypothetical protein
MKYETEHLQQLVVLFGRLHATFWPVRRYADNFCINGPTAAMNYRSRGVPWLSAGGSAADRKADERFRAELADMGLVRLVKGRTLTSGAVLTDLGMAVAQDATDCPTLGETRDLLDRIWCLRTDGDGFELAGISWASECKLASTTYEQTNAISDERDKLAKLTDEMIPGILAGIVSAKGDQYGRLWYGIGQSSALPSLSLVIDHREGKKSWLAEPSDALVDLYCTSRTAERNRLAAVKPEHAGDIGIIPHSCSPSLRKFLTQTH